MLACCQFMSFNCGAWPRRPVTSPRSSTDTGTLLRSWALPQPLDIIPDGALGRGRADDGWNVVLAAASQTERAAEANQLAAFALADAARLRSVPVGHVDALIAWRPGSGWEPV